MLKLKQILFGALGFVAFNAQSQTPAKELVNLPVTQQECGQDVDVYGPYSVVASKFGYNTGGAIQLFHNDQFIKEYKHDQSHDGDHLGMPETVAMGEHAIVIGAPLYKHPYTGEKVGRVEVFKKTWDGSHYATNYSQFFREGSYEIETDFGRAVDINGNWIAVGAPKKGREGGVKMFERHSDGYWIDRGWLSLPNFENAPYRKNYEWSSYTNEASFGSDVAIMNNRMIVGAPGVGSFYIYEYNGSRWVLKGEYQGPKVSSMGIDVTITDNHALGSTSNQIAVYQKHWDGSWKALQTITSNDHIDDIAVENRHLVVGKANGDTDGHGIAEYYELRSHPVGNTHVYDFVMIGKMHVDVNASPNGLVNHKRLGYSVAIQGDVVVTGAHNAYFETVADGAAFRAPFHQMDPISGQYRIGMASTDSFEGSESASSLSFFPNPAVDVINISTQSKIHSVTFTNTAGNEKTLAVEGNQVNVSGLPSGLYIMTVFTENDVITEKVKIQ